MRINPPPRRSDPAQRGLTPAEHARAARLSREMALYARVMGGASPVATKAPVTPGSPAFAQAARRDYEDLLALYGGPRLSPAFVVAKWGALPAPVAGAFERFRAAQPGQAEIALSTIDGQRAYQAQVLQPGGAQVLLLDARGLELGRGAVRGAAVVWRR